MLQRRDIAQWIRDRATEAGRSVNDPGELVANIYTCLRAKMFVGMACNVIQLARLVSGALIVHDAIRTNETKGKDYAPGSDVLENFYRVAAVTGVSPLVVWGVYITKHIEAINTFVNHGKLESEPIESRLVDVLVYSALGYYIAEREGGVK